jgi:hypothetical protein
MNFSPVTLGPRPRDFQENMVEQQQGLLLQVYSTVLTQLLRRKPTEEDFQKLTQKDELTPVGFMYKLFYDKIFLGWVSGQHTYNKTTCQMGFSVEFTPLYSRQPTRQVWQRG